MADKSDIANLLALFKAGYPNYNPDMRITAELYLQTLADIPSDTLRAAGMACVTELGRQFAPSVGEIRKAAIMLNALAAGIPDAQTAYSEVANMPRTMTRTKVVEEHGQFFLKVDKLEFSHPFVQHVAALIGWPTTFPTDEPGVDRAQFVKFYEAQLGAQMTAAGRMPELNDYIASKRNQMAGELPGMGSITRKLEAK